MASLEFGREAGFYYLLAPVFPLIMVSGRIGMAAKWTLAGMLAMLVLWLDRFISPPVPELVSYAFLTANGVINSAAAALMVSALMAYYYHMVVQASRQLEEMAYLDPLTGLMTRRRFEDLAITLRAEVSPMRPDSAVVLADIDHFKKINDTFGHDAGDETLRQVGALFNGDLRGNDIACRWGGEEFLLLLPGTTTQEAVRVAERLRSAFEHYKVTPPVDGIQITMTFGVASLPGGSDLNDAILRADRALYEGKASGRNRVCLAQSPMVEKAQPVGQSVNHDN